MIGDGGPSAKDVRHILMPEDKSALACCKRYKLFFTDAPFALRLEGTEHTKLGAFRIHLCEQNLFLWREQRHQFLAIKWPQRELAWLHVRVGIGQ